MTSALLLVLEGLVLGTLTVDLSHGFLLVTPPSRTALLACALLGGAIAFRSRRAPTVPWRAPILALAAGAVAVGLLGLLENRGAAALQERWEPQARDRLEARAHAIEEDFRRFLEDLSRPLERAGAGGEDRSAAFAAILRARTAGRLPPERTGLSAYREDGSPWAWDGNCSDAPRALLAAPCPGPSFAVGGREASRRLYAGGCSPDGARWVSEFVLAAPDDGEPRDAGASRLAFLPQGRDPGPASVRFREESGGQDDLAQLFSRQGDRLWGRPGGNGTPSLAFPLRSPGGERLAIVSLRDRQATQEIGDRRQDFRLAGGVAIALAILAAWCLPLRSGAIRSRRARILVGSASLWAVRASLLVMADPAALPRTSIYDISIYASSGLLGLLRSPADLLLTAAAFCAQAWIVGNALRSIDVADGPARVRARRAAVAAAILILAAGAPVLHVLLDRMALDTRLDVSRVETSTLDPPRLLLQASLFLFVLSFGLLLRALCDLALRHGRGPGAGGVIRFLRGADSEGIPFALRSAGWMLLLTLAYAPILHHSYDRLRRAFFEDELRPIVLDQKRMRRQALRESLATARHPDFAAIAAQAADGFEAAAFRLWLATPVAERGLASSLRVFDARGALLSRFAVDFAPMLEVPFEVVRSDAGGSTVEVPPRPGLTVRKPVIFGSRWIGGARLPLLVVVTISDDYDNLPILGGPTIGAGLFRASATLRSNPELLRTEPLMAVFSKGLSRLYESGGEIPPPSPATLEALERDGVAWTRDDLRGGEAFVLYFRAPREIFALAHLHPGRTALLASYMRLFLLNCLLGLLVAGTARAIAWLARPRRPRLSLGATYSRRLVTVFLLAGLLPLLTLAYFATRTITREIDRNISTTGLASLQVARRVAEDYLTVTGPEEAGSLDDDVVYWLSRVVRQDINVYRDAELLATGTRELYGSGLLNTRLNGESYRAIYLDREPFWLAKERTGGLDLLTLTAPMRIDRQGTVGAISIPLVEHRRAAVQREEEIQDAVLIVTCAAILLLALVGNILAQRVSRPVVLLAGAARRVAAGDLQTRVETTAGDETGVLVEAFNRMAGSLQRQRADLERRTDYIEKILRSATTGVVSIDGSGTIITINPAAQALLAARGDVPEAGAGLQEHLARDSVLEPLLSALRRALRGRVEREIEVEIAGPRGDARARPEAEGPRRLRAVFIPFAPEAGARGGLIVLLEDVTEIVRSGRLAAWAEMARRVAHEIKNPLTPIQLSVEHVRRVFKAKDARFERVLVECLDNIQRQVAVLREIALEFSAYARLPQLRPEAVPVPALVDEALRPYAAAAPMGVAIDRRVPADLPPIVVDRAVMARALVNVIENALQAMPSGGTLEVTARSVGGPADGRRVAIAIRDTGTGMSEAVLAHLFEPYFSTKSGGTGLGLGLARRAVEEHGGTIEVRSRPGEGTVVTLTLPAPALAAEAVPGSGGGTPPERA